MPTAAAITAQPPRDGALLLQQKLGRVGRAAFLGRDPHAALTSAALLREDDVAIGIAHSGATTDTIEPLALAGRRGAVTVAQRTYDESLAALALTRDAVRTRRRGRSW